jgi:hypothetical protein
MNLASLLQDAVMRALSVDEESLTLSLEANHLLYELVVYNTYTIESAEDSPSLIGSKVEQVSLSAEAIRVGFSNSAYLMVSLSETSYSGPEAVVLYDAVGTPLVVGN